MSKYDQIEPGSQTPLWNALGSILYAPRMPADPFARSVFIRSLYSRSLPSKRHANAHTLGGGDQGTQRRGPRGAGGGARADARCARARADARAARAGAPWGGKGTAYTQQKLCQTEYIIPTNAIPYGIHTGGNQETFSLKFKEGFSAESGAFARP